MVPFLSFSHHLIGLTNAIKSTYLRSQGSILAQDPWGSAFPSAKRGIKSLKSEDPFSASGPSARRGGSNQKKEFSKGKNCQERGKILFLQEIVCWFEEIFCCLQEFLQKPKIFPFKVFYFRNWRISNS